MIPRNVTLNGNIVAVGKLFHLGDQVVGRCVELAQAGGSTDPSAGGLMKLRDHRAEARNALIGTFPKALLGEITSRLLVYVQGRPRADSAHPTLYNCASDFIRKV